MKRTSLASRIAAPLASVAPCAAAAGPRFCLLLIAISAGTPALAFDYFEHRYIGEKAYENARNRHPDLSKALDTAGEALGFGRVPKDPRDVAGRVLQELPMQFGDLSALAGDLTENPEELREVVYDIKKWVGGTDAPPPLQLLHVITTRRIYRAESLVTDSRRQWFSACKWMYRRRFPQPGSGAAWENWANCFAQLGDQEFTLPRRSAFSSEGYQASHVELAEHEMIPKYISLAAENKEHFARYSWKEYSDNHARALKLARCYREKQECVGADGETKRGDALLVEMLVYEAYAQHFLHDSYASGHIGVAYSKCPIEKITLLCTPTKRRMQQTHDVLNEIGLDVAMPDAADVLKLSPKVAENLATGWTAFGDDYLFVPEADFHRSVVVLVATSSMTEVFDEATRPVPPPVSCRMCTTTIFPVPEERILSAESVKLRGKDLAAEDYKVGDLVKFELFAVRESHSLDPRVPGIPAEGWKVSFGLARQFRGHFQGHSELAPASDNGLALTLDYVRSTDPLVPNSFGFEYLNVPDRGSAYLFTTGWAWPREVVPISFAVKGKLGWRTEENFTPSNPTSERHRGVQLSFPAVEATWEVYPPVSIVAQVSLATWLFENGEYQSEYLWKGNFEAFISVRFDLAGIR